jgi:hypothetical protein
VFGRELRLPCDLLFGVPPNKERPKTDYAAELVYQLYDIHNYARQNLKLASARMKTRYDKLTNSAGYQEGDRFLALSSNPHERKIAKTAILVGRPIHDSHPHKRYGIQNPEESEVEDDGDTPVPTRTLSGCRSRRVHLRRERRVAVGEQPPPKER